jgi:serine/threonine protein kinase
LASGRARLERPAPCSVARIKRAYALRDEVDPSWAARPVELVRHEENQALVLHDPGGDFLESLLGRPMEVRLGLRIAIGIVEALDRFHARGLIHRDVKPGNLLVSAATGRVWLKGFGLTLHLSRDRPSPEPPENISGTLAYMAPEQTGWMNRSIDSRSDLYSLGVTLYQMFVGALPFTAGDPMEWVHCHIAREPTPPKERLNGIPSRFPSSS